MKKQFGKKIWSVLLALVMLLSLLPVSAFADDTTAAVETTIDEQSLAGNNITGGRQRLVKRRQQMTKLRLSLMAALPTPTAGSTRKTLPMPR